MKLFKDSFLVGYSRNKFLLKALCLIILLNLTTIISKDNSYNKNNSTIINKGNLLIFKNYKKYRGGV